MRRQPGLGHAVQDAEVPARPPGSVFRDRACRRVLRDIQFERCLLQPPTLATQAGINRPARLPAATGTIPSSKRCSNGLEAFRDGEPFLHRSRGSSVCICRTFVQFRTGAALSARRLRDWKDPRRISVLCACVAPGSTESQRHAPCSGSHVPIPCKVDRCTLVAHVPRFGAPRGTEPVAKCGADAIQFLSRIVNL